MKTGTEGKIKDNLKKKKKKKIKPNRKTDWDKII